ncbi:hypothetical protein ACFQ7J_21775 [Streptomyces sp. NPDC056501]|uniref:hypothetical protein n=1 Tax=Streptomyces sp. NPDC056501 TaxID=3345841 RepID=UPI0036AE5154
MAGGSRRLDALGHDGTRMEFQQSKETVPNTHSKTLAHAIRLMWIFSAINQHFARDFAFTSRQGARVTFEWTRAWTLIGRCNGRVLLDVGLSYQVGVHVLVELDHFEIHRRTATGTGVLRDAQQFCYWMRDGHPLPPYYWAPRAA